MFSLGIINRHNFITRFLQVNTLFSLCHLIVKWKRAELKHRARLSATKQD
ncbi:hypothetical protein HanPI659440_Chr00c05g0714411 [Helianthus annuus]|nr:hypothetical protein HanPI659440_Chr00c05g0714411 [Helianthus annuus]